MPTLIAQITADLAAKAALLEERRRQLFFKWLQAHHQYGAAISQETLEGSLAGWLGQLSPAGVGWESRLILSEIDWWRDLDKERLARIRGGEP